uniref:Uncharacterized protein n=1 Tax=Nelumbo nucifera TaxID=4432 RepID=A0A822YGK1_NELNU|nr:TPA_asm: hypothetical protein HUJ06_009230 [Nelumbo nucifera]
MVGKSRMKEGECFDSGWKFGKSDKSGAEQVIMGEMCNFKMF